MSAAPIMAKSAGMQMAVLPLNAVASSDLYYETCNNLQYKICGRTSGPRMRLRKRAGRLAVP
jgi:hypothetical protein